MTIYGPSIGTLWRTIESYGLDPRLVISENIYTPGARATSQSRIPYHVFAAMRSKAVELIGDPAVGLRSSGHIHPSHMGPLGHAWLASSTLLDGFRRIERYGRMFNENEYLVIEEAGDFYAIAIHVPPVDHVDQVRDAIMADLVALCRFNSGPDLNPDRVRLMRQPPRDTAPWFGFFKCPIDFGCEADQLVFSKTKILKPLSGSDPLIAAIHDEVIERYLGTQDRSDIVARTRIQILDQLASGRISEEAVAGTLNMTKRTLHRKLREHNLTFRAVLEDTRKTLVRRYLDDPTLSLTEVAFLLGFADSSAFSRAFRRWYGKPPGAERNARGHP